jgi:hypothetical protein
MGNLRILTDELGKKGVFELGLIFWADLATESQSHRGLCKWPIFGDGGKANFRARRSVQAEDP